MAVTQIIGPRIAPLWADPVEWTSTRAYEPFTFVTYQGDSYCSRKDTPIGIQITNDDYWVKVSEYNAQAVALQRSMTHTIETAEASMDSTIQTAKNSMTEQVNSVAKTIETAEASMNSTIQNAHDSMTEQVNSVAKTIETAESSMNSTIQNAHDSMAEQVNAVESVKNEFKSQLDNVADLNTSFDSLSLLHGPTYNPALMKPMQKVASWPSDITSCQSVAIDDNGYIYLAFDVHDNTPGWVVKFRPLQNDGDTLTEVTRIHLANSYHCNSMQYFDHRLYIADGGSTPSKKIAIVDTDNMVELDPIETFTPIVSIGVRQEIQTNGRIVVIEGSSYNTTQFMSQYYTYDSKTKTLTDTGFQSVMDLPQNSAFIQGSTSHNGWFYQINSRLNNRSMYKEYMEMSYILIFAPTLNVPYTCVPLPYSDSLYNELEGIYVYNQYVYVASLRGIFRAFPDIVTPEVNWSGLQTNLNTYKEMNFEWDTTTTLKLPNEFFQILNNQGLIMSTIRLYFKTSDMPIELNAINTGFSTQDYSYIRYSGVASWDGRQYALGALGYYYVQRNTLVIEHIYGICVSDNSAVTNIKSMQDFIGTGMPERTKTTISFKLLSRSA